MDAASEIFRHFGECLRATRKQYNAEEKIRIVLEGLRGEDSIAELCRREGIAQGVYYKWSKDFMEAGKRRLAGDTARAANLGSLVFRGDASHKSSDYHDATNTPQLMSDAYWTLNARTTFIPPKDNFELAFFVTNITDKIHVTNGVSVMGLGYVEAYYSRPREWGGELKVNF